MIRPIILLAGLGFAGCATTQEPAAVATDTYCITARKIQWSVEDTKETIQKVEVHNKTIDLRCGVPGKKA